MGLVDIEVENVKLTISGEVVWKAKTTRDEPGHSTYVDNFAVYLDFYDDGSLVDITDSIDQFTRESLEERIIEEDNCQEERAKAMWEDAQEELWKERRHK